MPSLTFTIEKDGRQLSGRRTAGRGLHGGPLIVALHGGSYSSAFFDIPGYSLLDRAAQSGCPAIAFDRPGYGASTLITDQENVLSTNAELLDAAIGDQWQEFQTEAPGVVLIGHSIGAAVSILIAGRALDWPLLGIALSGIGMVFPPDGPPFERRNVTIERVDVPLEVKNQVMFGPVETFAEDAPQLAQVANEPAVYREINDINLWWPAHAEQVCGQVRVPVHFRQGEYDPVWSQRDEDFKRFRDAFCNAPQVDAKIIRNAGHSIDLHLVGPAFQAEQIAFARTCTTPKT